MNGKFSQERLFPEDRNIDVTIGFLDREGWRIERWNRIQEGRAAGDQIVISVRGSFAAILRTDRKAYRSARQFEPLRTIADQIGRNVQFRGLAVAVRRGVDIVECGLAPPPLAQYITWYAGRMGHSRLIH